MQEIGKSTLGKQHVLDGRSGRRRESARSVRLSTSVCLHQGSEKCIFHDVSPHALPRERHEHPSGSSDLRPTDGTGTRVGAAAAASATLSLLLHKK